VKKNVDNFFLPKILSLSRPLLGPQNGVLDPGRGGDASKNQKVLPMP